MSDYSKKLLTKALNNMDTFLSELSLARKAITKDESCLFRAVSEKLFFTQCHHEKVKDACLDYLVRHKEEYQPFIAEAISDRAERIREGKTQAGHMEMIIMSRMYRMDFVLFHTPSLNHYNLTDNFYHQIYLCYVSDNHYDLVYSKNYLQTAAVCQSIVYELLYSRVFGLSSELEEAVLFLELQKPLSRDSGCLDCAPSDVLNTVGPDKVDVIKKLCGVSSPPVPYRIAKALHPALYRNVELDIVQEEKRELRVTNLTNRKGFSPGDKCQVLLDNNDGSSSHLYNAHIQEIDDQAQTVLAFIEELGVKQTVPSDCLRPLPIPIHKLDESPQLPVAELDLLPYVKRNRRRKGVVGNVFGRSVAPNNYIPDQRPRIEVVQSPPKAIYNSKSSQRRGNFIRPSNNTKVENPCSGRAVTPECQHPLPGGPVFSYGCTTPDSGNNSPPTQDTDNNQSYKNFNNNRPPHCNGNNQLNYSFHGHPTHLDDSYSYEESQGFEHCSGEICPPFAPKFGPVPIGCINPVPEPGVFAPHLDPTVPPTYCIMSAGGQGATYWMQMPMVAVPYASNMGQVNMTWGPSHDPYGKDLPLSGVEYYRMSSCGQPGGYQPAMMYPAPPGADMTTGPYLMDTGYSNVMGCPPDMHVPRQSATPSQVMYMVSPTYPPTQAYQQPSVLVSPNCPVPVQ